MSLLILSSILLASCQLPDASAEWVDVDENKKGDTFYGDPSTIRWKGPTVKIWMLIDHAAPSTLSDGRSFRSTKQLMEINCAEEQHRMLDVHWYEGRMGNGKIVQSSYEPGLWKAIIPASIVESFWNYSCRQPGNQRY